EVISDPKLAREVAIQLKLYNVGVAIDDFGSGYSNLAQVRTLPFTELKIDRSHVKGIAVERQNYLRCESIVSLAHRLGMVVVAEGVESAEDVEALIEMDCDMAQGVALARPMERDEYKRWAADRAGIA